MAEPSRTWLGKWLASAFLLFCSHLGTQNPLAAAGKSLLAVMGENKVPPIMLELSALIVAGG